MDRRYSLKSLWAAALGLYLPELASQSTVEVSIGDAAYERPDNSRVGSKKVACKIIGVGDAGCNIVLAAWSSGLLHAPDCQSDFACVSMGRQNIRDAISANRRNPWNPPIRPVELGKYGAGGNVNVARAAAQKNGSELRALITGAEVVILVAGIGGGTGSAVAPILASMAEESGALVLATVISGFRWEVGKFPNALEAIKALERHSHYLVSLSNQVVGDLLGDEATLDDLIAQQELLGTACIHRLMVDSSRYCIDRHNRLA